MFRVENRHWWYVGMQRITTRLVTHFYPNQTNLQILDAGCGTGAAMAYLAPFGHVTGCDLSSLALSFCRQRSLSSLAQASVTELPFPVLAFDLVVSFDVLYHQAVADVNRALVEFWRVLRPGGRLFLRLPAYDWLRGHHDRVIHTARRFSRGQLRRSLVGAGYDVEKISYANTLLFPLALTKRLSERILPATGSSSDIQANASWRDSLLSQFLFAEASWLTRAALPFGLTVIAVARRPEDQLL